MSIRQLKQRRRMDYQYILDYRTRWSDNDMYDHMNNSIYNFLFDSVVNTYLIEECGLNPPTSPEYGLVVHSQANFFEPIAFPAIVELALRVNKLGTSSVTYEIGIFEKGTDAVKSVGEVTHVFVDRATGRHVASGMSKSIREGLQKILVPVSKL